MQAVLDGAESLGQMLWRMETEGRDFSTPERRAGLERALAEVVSAISDSKIADYYRRDFEQQVFDTFKRRARAPSRWTGERNGSYERVLPFAQRPPHSVSPAVKASLIGRARETGARLSKEEEIAHLLLDEPALAQSHGETLAALSFKDPSLDSLRRELLNLAASGLNLESRTLENHLVRKGMAELVVRLRGRQEGRGNSPADASTRGADVHDPEARFLEAAADLRDLAEFEPERERALERFRDHPSDETWADVQRLLAGRTLSND